MKNALVQTVESFYTSQWGIVTYLKVYTPDYARLRPIELAASVARFHRRIPRSLGD